MHPSASSGGQHQSLLCVGTPLLFDGNWLQSKGLVLDHLKFARWEEYTYVNQMVAA